MQQGLEVSHRIWPFICTLDGLPNALSDLPPSKLHGKFERIAKDLDGYLLRSLSFDHRKSASLTPLSLFRPVDLRCCLLLCDKTRTRDFLTNLFCRFQPATPGKQHQRSPLRFCPSQASSHPYPHFTSPCSHPSTNVYPHALVVHLAVN